jgi:hypothetical protein
MHSDNDFKKNTKYVRCVLPSLSLSITALNLRKGEKYRCVVHIKVQRQNPLHVVPFVKVFEPGKGVGLEISI